MNPRSCAGTAAREDSFAKMDPMAVGAWAAYHANPQDSESRNALLLIYKPLADRAARSEARAGGDFYLKGQEIDDDDLKQMAVLALVDLIEDYKPQSNSSFTKYAAPLIRLRVKEQVRSLGWVSRHGRRQGCKDNRISGDAPMERGWDGRRECCLFDVMESLGDAPELPAELTDFRERVKRGLGCDRDRRIFSLKFLGGMSSRQIGDALELSEASISIRVAKYIIPAIAAAFPDGQGGPEGVALRLKLDFRASHVGGASGEPAGVPINGDAA